MSDRQQQTFIEPPDNPKALAGDLVPFLSQFSQMPSSPFVFPHVISFTDSQQKSNWQNDLADWDERKTIRDFYTMPKNGKKCWILFASVDRINWVATGDAWKKEPWHCFAMALIQDPAPKGGKHLVVFDPDPSPITEPVMEDGKAVSKERRITAILRGQQRNIYSWIKNNKSKNLRVWYSVDQSFGGKDKCLLYSLTKVQEWARIADQPWQGEEDPRARNCIQLKNV
ncbi:hypothetical protein FGRMN_4169 [Fusarium graminum]|nr:hypothetical protein FGRMN_4169 [Fusarium graminum]